MVQYLFRAPTYPLLIETDARVVGARSGERIDQLHDKSWFEEKQSYAVIDATGESWTYVPEFHVISPLTLERWTKAKIIEFFNNSLEKAGITERYKPRSLSNRRLDQLIREIVELENSL